MQAKSLKCDFGRSRCLFSKQPSLDMKDQKSIYLSDLHFEHRNWLSELTFWKEELVSFQNRLAEVVSRWTDKSVLAQAEHFQNQFIRHNEVIDILRHEVKLHEQELSIHAEEHPIGIEHQHFSDHADFREQMETQRHIYNDLKKEFFSFLVKTM